MKQDVIIGYRNGEPIIEEGILIKTADPYITGRIFEIDSKYFVRGKTDEVQPKWFNRLSEAIQYCQPKKYSWS